MGSLGASDHPSVAQVTVNRPTSRRQVVLGGAEDASVKVCANK